jgi:phosphosulfolactate phosphohydrolase-like enzyme
MILDRAHPACVGQRALGVAVVIDVLRATSTAAVLIGRGISEVLVAAKPQDLARLPPRERGYLILSELPEARAFGECIDNSPSLAERVALNGRMPVLVTTNGTRALDAAAARSDHVLLASFLNVSAVAQWLRTHHPERITLLPAGKFSRVEHRTEDELCADLLESSILGRSIDVAALCRRIREDEQVRQRLAEERSLDVDVDLALRVDHCPVVPAFARQDGPIGKVTRL